MKVKVSYTYEVMYEETPGDEINTTNKILKDFSKLDTMAANILPSFDTSLHVEYLENK